MKSIRREFIDAYIKNTKTFSKIYPNGSPSPINASMHSPLLMTTMEISAIVNVKSKDFLILETLKQMYWNV